MAPVRPRTAIAAVVVAAVALAWFLWWRGAAVQVPLTFARLVTAIEGGDDAGTLAELHPDYDLRRQFPDLVGEAGEPRQAMLGLLFAVYRVQHDDPFVVATELGPVASGDDGSAVVEATIHLSSRSGQLPVAIDPALHRRFVLRRSGWLGRFRILDHEPIAIGHP